MFEAVLLLNYNDSFWGDQPVAETIRSPLYGKSKERLKDLKNQVKFEADFIEGNIT